MKIIAFIAAILSAATVATLAFTTIPAVQKQAADNAAAIEQNAEYFEEIQEQIKPKYLHTLVNSSYKIVCYIKNNNSNPFTDSTLLEYINSTPEKCLFNYYGTTISLTETTTSTSIILYLKPPKGGGAKFSGATITIESSHLNWGVTSIYTSFTDTVTEL